jgi:signal transduction histidine kinase
VRVDLAGEDNLLHVTVEDNGRGMAATGSDQDVFSLGIGIKWMMTRMRQLGGQVSIQSGPQGTSVRVVVPTVHSDGG